MKKFLLSLFILAFMLAGTAYSQRIGGENPNLQPGSWGSSGGAQIYPGTGVANSNGSGWGSSYGVGTAANDLVQLNGSAQLPPLDGSQLLNLPPGTPGPAGPAGPQGATGSQGPSGQNGASVGTYTSSGGAVVWVSGYTYSISPCTYYIGGTKYTSALQSITLSAAYTDYDRISAIALNASGVAVEIEGSDVTPVLYPYADPTLYCQIGTVYVTANSSAPSTVINTIYNEGGEWTTTGNGTGNNITVGDTTAGQAYSGTHEIKGASVPVNSFILSISGSPIPAINQWDYLVFYIKIPTTAWISGKNMQVRWINSGTSVGSIVTITNGSYGFSSSTTGAYQQIVIPISSFGIPTGSTVDRMRITFVGSGTAISFYIDYIQLQQGVNSQGQYPVNYRGAWNSTTAYNVDDVVTYQNASYIGTNPSTNQPPSATSTYWGILGIIQSAGDTTFNATQTVNWATGGNVQKITLTGSISSISFSGWVPGQTYTLILKQAGSGSYTVALPPSSSAWKWQGGSAPTLSTAVGTADWIIMKVDADSIVYASSVLDFL